MSDFADWIDVLSDSPFEEYPVDVVTFVTDRGFLGLPPLSPIQYEIVEAMSQIYYEKELVEVLGEQKGREHFRKYTKTEIILKLGKGSGKDHTNRLRTFSSRHLKQRSNVVHGSEENSIPRWTPSTLTNQ